jgi:hypothetical protein
VAVDPAIGSNGTRGRATSRGAMIAFTRRRLTRKTELVNLGRDVAVVPAGDAGCST